MSRMGLLSEHSQELFSDFVTNVRARLRYLGVTPRGASVGSGHNPTWLTDAFRMSSYITFDRLVKIADAVGIPLYVLIMCPPGTMTPAEWPCPEWHEKIEKEGGADD